MVERKIDGSAVQEQQELFTHEDYPERWSFRIKRHRGHLTANGLGTHDGMDGHVFEVELEFVGSAWVLKFIHEYGAEKSEVPGEVEKEMFRQFTAFKARFLHRKGKAAAEAMEGEYTRTTRRWR